MERKAALLPTGMVASNLEPLHTPPPVVSWMEMLSAQMLGAPPGQAPGQASGAGLTSKAGSVQAMLKPVPGPELGWSKAVPQIVARLWPVCVEYHSVALVVDEMDAGNVPGGEIKVEVGGSTSHW